MVRRNLTRAPRLGLGPFIRKGIDDVRDLRNKLLWILEIHAPHVLESLSDKVLPLYQALPCRTPPKKLEQVNPSAAIEPDREKAKAAKRQFIDTLTGWARTWSLDCPWMLDMAVYLCWTWHRFPGHQGTVWGLPNGVRVLLDTKDLKPPAGFRDWEPWMTELREDYLVYAENLEQAPIAEALGEYDLWPWGITGYEAFADALRQQGEYLVKAVVADAERYCKAVERRYKRQGYKPSTPQPELYRNLEMFVRIQVLGEKMRAVGDYLDMEPSYVNREYHKLREALELPRREDTKRGRPKGAEDAYWRRRYPRT